MKKTLSVLLTLALVIGLLAACGAKRAEAPDDEENYETGDASLDDPRNGDDIGEKEILVVSFGTSFNDSRRLTIGAIERDIEKQYPKCSVRRAFTSQIIIDHIKERDGEQIDNVDEALKRAVDNGVKELIIQPTHLMNGIEYNDLVAEVANYADAFEKVSIGEPLLTSSDDFVEVITAVASDSDQYLEDKTAVVLMGHGTEAESNAVYEKMQMYFSESGLSDYFVGTVEATPSLDDVIAKVKEGDYKRVVLRPLMVVAGDHANNDMAGDDEDSWKSRFEKEGYEVVTVLSGLGEIEDIRKIYVQHVADALGSSEQLSDADAPMDQVADKSEMTSVDEVLDPDMTPVTSADLNPGTYKVNMRSSSSMFKVGEAEVKVEPDSLEVTLYMTSKAYSSMFAGTAEDASKADDTIPLQELEDGRGTFSFPIDALDAEVSAAAFSVKKQKWYDRTLLFEAASLPDEAFVNRRFMTAEDLGLTDGDYICDVALSGGSGRASITSPCRIRVDKGFCLATIEWSSDKYDYMEIDGTRYEPENTEGNSVFTIPIKGFDYEMPVQADTTAMSQPYLIDYTLRFDSSSIK